MGFTACPYILTCMHNVFWSYSPRPHYLLLSTSYFRWTIPLHKSVLFWFALFCFVGHWILSVLTTAWVRVCLQVHRHLANSYTIKKNIPFCRLKGCKPKDKSGTPWSLPLQWQAAEEPKLMQIPADNHSCWELQGSWKMVLYNSAPSFSSYILSTLLLWYAMNFKGGDKKNFPLIPEPSVVTQKIFPF